MWFFIKATRPLECINAAFLIGFGFFSLPNYRRFNISPALGDLIVGSGAVLPTLHGNNFDATTTYKNPTVSFAISGTTVTLSSNVGATLTAVGVTYGQPIFKTFGAISA